MTLKSRGGTEPSSSIESPWHQSLTGIVFRYGHPAWPNLPLDWTRVSPFARCVLSTLRETVPAGTWTTYRDLARRCGSPRAAQAVGNVMACNPWPLYVPCHRVIRSDGSLGRFGPGEKLKHELLALENAVLPK
ncbi:MAG: MGMT family protein [Deltaproteobacteria bacterium]|nr:MGMT family protein [Deltaproteobacteria bacterium]